MSSDESDSTSTTVNQSSYAPNESQDSAANSVIQLTQNNINAKDKDFTMPEQGLSDHSETKVPIPTHLTSHSLCNPTVSDESTIEKFDGKIVYNPDGSAYIIDDGELGDDETLLPLPRQEGSIVESTGHPSTPEGPDQPAYPQIANAIYVTRSAAYYNALYGQAYAKLLRDKTGGRQEAPIVHSYRVYSVRDGGEKHTSGSDPPLAEHSTVPVKPILMCFVCKLSFGNSASFTSHCAAEHNIQPSEAEKNVLNAKNSSAILQPVGKEKEPLLSFLEPVVKTSDNEREKQSLSPNAIKGLLSAALTQQGSGGMPSMRLHGQPHLNQNEALALQLRQFNQNMPLGSPDQGDKGPGMSASLLLENLTSAAMLRNSIVESLSRRSPISSSNHDNGRSGSVSPVTPIGGGMSPMSQAPSSGFASNANMLQGTTIGACPEHINGRQAGVDCANCDLILNVARVPGGAGWNAARNTCKTLKCPKCNWHYKYQETLEIHMKEKHPESETTCIYCITGQQHPRLARGETYTCGYKPYRCEVCNYSTTTKGNLSIHMQSDKHLNNMQELQNGGVVSSPEGISLPQSPGSMNRGNPMMNNALANMNKQKPSWRCDVCNYETGVARNLRIHMTSEKHTHNIMVLQQNVKHMQQQMSHHPGLSMGPPGLIPGMPGLDPQALLQQLPLGAMGFPGNGGGSGDKPGPPEAAIADIAYLQALMMQMVTGGQFPPGPQPPDFGMMMGGSGGPSSPMPNLDGGVNPDSMEPPPEPPDPNPKHLFNCCVCQEFACDTLDVMSHHLTMDRSNMREHEVAIVIGTNYICKLCSYKTNLKANFQLHCKTDKHLQRLNHVNHIKEGGPDNEWKLKFLTVSNPVQLRCNVCDYYTNSLHKLQLHVANQRHEISTILFTHLIKREGEVAEDCKSFRCLLCKFASPGKLALLNHVKTLKHLQMEQLHQLQKRSEGIDEQTEIGDIFRVDDSSRSERQSEDADDNPEDYPDQNEKDSNFGDGDNSKDEESVGVEVSRPISSRCPLCQEGFSSYSALESHVLQIHSVNSEGLQRLVLLMEGSHWLNNNRDSAQSPNNNSTSDDEDAVKKPDHNNADQSVETSPSTSGSSSSNLRPTMGTFSEKHVYKYRCGQCSLAFKTSEKLALHSQYHAIRESTKCRICSRNFRSIQALLKHVDSSHTEIPSEELAQYKLALMNHPLLLAGLSGQVFDSNPMDPLKKEVSPGPENDEEDVSEVGDTSGGQTNSTEGSFLARDANDRSATMTDNSMRKAEKSLNYPLEKYLDPNRPYKCDVCKESFTQKNILLVHYNSVSHLHKLKKSMQGQNVKDQGPEKPAPTSRMSSLETALSNLASVKQIKDDDEAKPYKCNICKVAYNQSSTLDIHIRSVLHQGRASKLPELAMTGQVDLSKPLIEQPDPKHDQQKKMFQDMVAFKSLNTSPNSSATQNSNNNGSSPLANPLATLQQALLGSPNNHSANQNPQQHMLHFLQNFPMFQNLVKPPSSGGPLSPRSNEEIPKAPFGLMDDKKSAHSVKNMLENYGFELVMQFNEYHQRKRMQDEEERKRQEEEFAEAREKQREVQQKDPEAEKHKVDTFETSLPEVTKSKCPVCNKEFSSIWVLKAHSEEVHRDVVPPEFLEKYVQELKSNMDKSKPNESDGEGSPEKTDKDVSFQPPESSDEPFFRSTSTPKDPPPPSGDENEKDSRSESVQSRGPSTSATPNIHDIPNAFQQAILSAQQQSQNINPMLLQMAQLQGMNPLVAMNLHPPLIPPSMMPPSNMDPVASAFLSQIQAAQEQQQQNMNAQNSVLSKLGIDAKMIGQSGLDPKLLLQLGQMDPKLLPQLSGDPSFASLLGSASKDKNLGLNPKGFFQMLQMGLPPSPDPKLLSQLAQMRGDKGMAQQQPPPPPPPPPPPNYHMDKKFPFSGGFPPFDQGNFAHSPTGQDPKSLLMQQKQMFQHPEQAKRARTRITDDQLKVLRSNFDINNSPAENQIHSMSQQTGLPPKVIKHWFRNTLFKERQRNKDSPYNFNNPPSTMLNLEEYEKTGESKVMPLKSDDHDRDRGADSDDGKPDNDRDSKEDLEVTEYIAEGSTASVSDIRMRNEEELFKGSANMNRPPLATTPLATVANMCNSIGSPVPTMSSLSQHLHTSSVSTPTTPVSERSSPCSTNLTLSSILSSQMNHMGKGSPGFLPPHLMPSFTGLGGSRLPDFLNPLANMMGGQDPQQSNRQVLMHSPTPQSQGQSSQGKRANRTRFTDYQIKVLQEFFENNAYPKDDDLEYLSKLLNLSPRVIVVWFQNARQKARKIYENQPPLDPNDEGAGRFTRTPGLNYQCKKCLLVFQRYYELIRHQKQHCFKEEDAKRSAQAQKAAAQAAAQFSRQQSSGGITLGAPSVSHTSDDSNSSTGLDRYVASPVFNQSGHEEFLKHRSEDWASENHMRSDEHKKMTPSMFDQLTREDTFSKMINPVAGSFFPTSYPPSTPFGILQQQALPFNIRDRDRDSGDELDNESVSSSPSSKRKHSDDGMDTDDKEESGQPRDKRLRTTILPEQLDFLYQKYQIESNPSRKMLEQIASEVGLRKRVVQVWFQNTRARERKGQFRAHQQVINKRCPFCPAIFRVRSALESHLSSKHIDQYTRGEIDIDSLPDAEGFHEGSFSEHARSSSTPIPSNQPAFASAPTHGFSQKQELEQSMRKYYEDTMKRYMNDLQGNKNDISNSQDESISTSATREGSHALDLSSPLPTLMSNNLPTFDLNSQRGMAENDDDSSYWDKDDQSVCSESNDYEHDESISHHEDSLLRSPLSPGQGSSARNQDTSNMGNKRFRTQMSGIQIKLMKSVFQFYKTPTMSECASLGKDIGLQKRVVQVWFQNARAKEKKARLQLHQMTGKDPDQPPVPTECNICNYSYSTPTAIQDHLFERLHLENVKLAIEQGHYEPQAPGEILNQAIAALQASIDNHKSQSSPLSSAVGSSPSNPSNNSHLQILQMAAQGIRLPNSSDTSEANSSFASSEDSEPRETMEKTLLHLYGMGRGLPPSFPSAVGPPNPFLHPAMFSATGK